MKQPTMLMDHTRKNTTENTRKQNLVPTVSAVLDDGGILEMVYQPAEKRSVFGSWKDGEWKTESGFSMSPFHRLV